MPVVSGGGSGGLRPLTVADIEACPDRASFLQLVMPYYQSACSQLGIRWPGVCALQCIYETGVPNNIAASLRQNNNMGGLKGTKLPGASVGTISSEGDHYARFESVDKYIYAAIYNIVNSGYYGDALAATTMEDFANKLCHTWVMGAPWGVGTAYGGPYDTKYAPDIIADYAKYGLASYENGGSGSINGANSGAQSGSTGDAQSGLIANKTFDSSVRERETARVEEGGNPELKTFYRINMTGAQFIRQVLAPYCRSQDTGQGAYRLWFDDETSPDGTPGVKLHFKPDQYNQIEDKMSENMLPDIERTYQFTFGSGPGSSVLDFNPNYAGMVTSVTGGYEVEATTTEAITNDLISTKYNRFTDPDRPSTGDSVYDDLQGTVRIGDSSYSFEDLANRAANLWYNMAPYGYTADMTVFGDPMIETQKLCSIAVYTPHGLPHHSSGVYLIYHVTDSISGGTFTTSLNLVRNAISIGTDDSGGVDITIGGQQTRYIGDAINLAGGAGGTSGGSGGTTAAGAMSGTDSSGTFSDSDFSDTVFVGDSMMAIRKAQLTAAFPGCTVMAKSGEPFTYILGQVQSIQGNPNRVVIGMGNNDWNGVSVAQANQLFDKLANCQVYLITMLVTNNKTSTEKTNHTIQTLASQRNNVHIIDWNGAIASNPKKYLKDNVHQNDEGFNVYVDLIRKAL